MDNWNKLRDDAMEYAPNIAPGSIEYYCYYLTVFFTVSLFGPISGLLFFLMPTLMTDDVNILIKKDAVGIIVPLFLWFSFSVLWLAGEGPMVCGTWIPGFKKYVLKADLYLQGFSRMCLLACFSLMYNKILSLYEFVADNEIS